jgi:ABC-type nitrate/sulfonate/bicarbonate transport system permease component
VAIAAELIAANTGLGFLITMGRRRIPQFGFMDSQLFFGAR